MTKETRLPTRSRDGRTSCWPPQANRPSGRPKTRRAWNTASAPKRTQAATAAGVVTSGQRTWGVQVGVAIRPGRQTGQARAASCTTMATCTRLLTSSLASSRETCALTVASLMNRSAAISALEEPAPTSVATWRSRSVRAARPLNGRAVPCGRFRCSEVGQQSSGHGRGDDGVAGCDHPDSVDDVRRGRVLDEEAGSPGA